MIFLCLSWPGLVALEVFSAAWPEGSRVFLLKVETDEIKGSSGPNQFNLGSQTSLVIWK